MLKEIKTDTAHYFVDEFRYKQGEYKKWHKNGQLCYTCYYIDNSAHGEYREWWDNGQMKFFLCYNTDEFHGEYKCWNENGQLEKHCFYINGLEYSFDEIPYPKTEEDRMYIKLKYDLKLLPVEQTC